MSDKKDFGGLPTTGRLGHLTPEQEETLKKFREEITTEGYFVPERHHDHFLLRFLRARKFHIPKTKVMFINYEKWYKEFGVSDIESYIFDEEPLVAKYYPRFYHKTDRLGRPVYIELVGQLDIKSLFEVTTEDRMTKNHVHEYERLIKYRLPACSKRAGTYLEQSCVIMDLKGVSLMHFAKVASFIKRTAAIAQEYYPEMLGRMLIINAPMLFTSVWAVIKPLLDEVTVNKIIICGSNYHSKLFEYIDKESVPAIIGGACNCPGGCEKSDMGPWQDPAFQCAPIPIKKTSAGAHSADGASATATATATSPTTNGTNATAASDKLTPVDSVTAQLDSMTVKAVAPV